MNIHNYSIICTIDSTLRPYQQKGKTQIFNAWDQCDNVMFQMPTGTGKTRLFTSIIKDINNFSIQRREAVKILIIAHRTELIEQIDDNLTKYHIAHNIIAGGYKRNIKYPVNIASIQTLTHPNNLDFAAKLNIQFIIIDEAHHAKASTYKKLWKLYPNSKKLGVTATPWRMNHSGFCDLFDKLITSLTIKHFINEGYLSPYKYYSLKSSSNIQKTIDEIALDAFGEYKEDSMTEHMDIGSIRAQLLKSYQALANGKKGIIYAINIMHAQHICKEYEDAGFIAVAIDSKTPSKERKHLVNEFKKGEIDIIVNVDIFSEGFDCPDIEFIQLARPTKSLVKYLQQVGRGLRKVENKDACIILDNVGMYSRFGLPDANRFWKHHFVGQKVSEAPQTKSIGKGWGTRVIDMSEGCEDMELIEDNSCHEKTMVQTHNPKENKIEGNQAEIIDGDRVNLSSTNNNPKKQNENITQIVKFDPEKWCNSYKFYHAGYLMWLPENKDVYEIYLHNNESYVINRLDVNGNSLKRTCIAIIGSKSPLFNRLENEDIDQIAKINYYGKEKTIIDLKLTDSFGHDIHQYFDFQGNQYFNHTSVEQTYKKALHEKETIDYSLPLSITTFRIKTINQFLSIYRCQGSMEIIIAHPLPISDFYKEYKLSIINNSQFYVFRTSDSNLYVRKVKSNESAKNIVYTHHGKKICEVDIPKHSTQKEYVIEHSNMTDQTLVFSNDNIEAKQNTEKRYEPSIDETPERGYTIIKNEDNSMTIQEDIMPFLNVFNNSETEVTKRYKTSFINEVYARGYGKIEQDEVYPINGEFYDFFLLCGSIEIYKYEISTDFKSLDKVSIAYADNDSEFCTNIRNRQIKSIEYAGRINEFGNYGIVTKEFDSNTNKYVNAIYDENGNKKNNFEPFVNIGLDNWFLPGETNKSYEWCQSHEDLSLFMNGKYKNKINRIYPTPTPKGTFVIKHNCVFDVYTTLLGSTVVELLQKGSGNERKIVSIFKNKTRISKNVIINAQDILLYDFGGKNTILGIRKESNSPLMLYNYNGNKVNFYTSIEYKSTIKDDTPANDDTIINEDCIYIDKDVKWSISIEKKRIKIYNSICNKNITIPKDNPVFNEIIKLGNPTIKNIVEYKNHFELQFSDKKGKLTDVCYYPIITSTHQNSVLIPNMPKSKKAKEDKVSNLSSKILSVLQRNKGLTPSTIADIVKTDISTVTILLNTTLKEKVKRIENSRQILWCLK